MRWVIESVSVLAPVRVDCAVLPTRTGSTRAIILRDVDYLINASVSLTTQARADERLIEHAAMFRRRIVSRDRTDLCYLGRPDFPARLTLIEAENAAALPASPLSGDVDFGWLPADPPYAPGTSRHSTPATRYFRAIAHDGTITIPPFDGDLVYA